MTEVYAKCKNCEKDCTCNDLLLMQGGGWVHIQGQEEEASDACFCYLCDTPASIGTKKNGDGK